MLATPAPTTAAPPSAPPAPASVAPSTSPAPSDRSPAPAPAARAGTPEPAPLVRNTFNVQVNLEPRPADQAPDLDTLESALVDVLRACARRHGLEV